MQGERTIDRAQGGLGIGLALVRNLVELHDGRVEARSDGPGKGSEFIVELPAAAGDAKLTPPPKRVSLPPAPLRARSRILVVDDNVDAAVGLGKALRERGHEVVVAHDGAQALAAAASFHPAIALLDIGLPVMNGYELARQLRALWTAEKTPEKASDKAPDKVRFVAITGYGQLSDREKALAEGFDAHLVKPVDFSKLLELLEAPAR